MKNILISFLLIQLCSCGNHINRSYMPLQTSYFDKEGHRGCRGLMPENTIPAYIRAINLGVNTLEMDVVITKDLQPIMSHEPFFNHEITTKPNGDTVRENEERSLNKNL
jgi:glycerophosphoryl diester phosphodiesterase